MARARGDAVDLGEVQAALKQRDHRAGRVAGAHAAALDDEGDIGDVDSEVGRGFRKARGTHAGRGTHGARDTRRSRHPAL